MNIRKDSACVVELLVVLLEDTVLVVVDDVVKVVDVLDVWPLEKGRTLVAR